MSIWKQILPADEGLLPIWQLLAASLAVFNALQNFATLKLTKRLYSRLPHQVTPLQSRSFGIWTLTSALVRFYCAYNIHNKAVYEIAIGTYVLAFVHFASELTIFRTASINAPVLSPVIFASTSLVWMLSQYHFYVQA